MEPDSDRIGTALQGIRVVSMAEQYPGPLCTQLLGDLGAEVIQLERPGGDPQRIVNPWLFRTTALGKTSVEIDLKSPEGLAATKDLVTEADVFIEGFRPGVADRLGVGFDELTRLNRHLVYCSISGYGQTGPYRLLAGHNVNYEAAAGMLDAVLRPDLDVTYFGSAPPIGDLVSGLLAALGIAAALRSVSEDSAPVHLDLSITDSIVFALAPNITRALNGDEPWTVREPGYGVFECSDGAVALGISYEDHFWRHLCSVTGLSDLAGHSREERMQQRIMIRERLASALAVQPVQHWVDGFGDVVPCSPVRRLADVIEDDHIRSRGLVVVADDEHGHPFRTVVSPFARRPAGAQRSPRRVPSLGCDNESVGLAKADVPALCEG